MISTAELKELAKDPQWVEKLRTEPEKTVNQIGHPIQTDKWIYRIVVGVLGAAILAAMYGVFNLAVLKVDVPDGITAIGAAAVGALAGLLAPSPAKT